MTKNKDKKNVKLQSGMTVSCEVFDDKSKYVGDFIFICSFCQFEYFDFNKDFTKLFCSKCKASTGYLLKGKWERPQDSPGRKWLGFYMENGAEYVWTCNCGHNLHQLVNKLTHTVCEKCASKTSRRKDLQIMAMTGGIKWSV